MFTILRGVLLHIYVFSLDYRYLDGSCEMNPTFDLASDTPMNVSHQLRKTLPKAQRTQGLSSSCQSHIASSDPNLDRISSSES